MLKTIVDVSPELTNFIKVQGYVRCMASHEERFPRPLANEADLPPESQECPSVVSALHGWRVPG